MGQPEGRYLAQALASELERDYEELLAFVNVSPVGLIEMAADGAVRLVNAVAMKLMLQIAPPPQMTNFFTTMQGVAPELRNLAGGFNRANGMLCENHPVFLAPCGHGKPDQPMVLNCTLIKLGADRLMAAISDISQQALQQRRLLQAETWLASLLDDVDEFGVLILDQAGVITAADPAVLGMTGFTGADMIGRDIGLFDIADHATARPSVADRLARARRNGWCLDEGWHVAANGARLWCQMLISVRAAGAQGMAARFTAVLRQVKQHEFNTTQLRRILTIDHLTGAYNRGHFFEAGERECLRAIRYQQPLSLIILDIDHFKQVNDDHGHAVGDEALKTIARTCMKLLRGPDMFARIGGEEFVILLPATGLDGALVLAERIRLMIAATEITMPAVNLRCTASFGCAAHDSRRCTLPDVLAAADAAMYKAKRAGRNRTMAAPCETI